MNWKLVPLTAALLCASAGAAHTQMACLVEGKMMGEQIKDCSQTSLPLPAADYAAQCKESGSVFAASGGSGGASVLKACPPQAQGSCVGPFGQPMSTFYYARSPEQLAATKSSCAAQKGKWIDKP